MPLVADENGMVPLEESWKLLKSLGSFKARGMAWKSWGVDSCLIFFRTFVLGYM